jgi:hypothetical protein
MLHAIGILSIPSVGRTTAGLRIGCTPGFRTKRSKKGGRMEGTGTHFEIVRLVDHATLVGPKTMQGEDKILEGHEEASPGSPI